MRGEEDKGAILGGAVEKQAIIAPLVVRFQGFLSKRGNSSILHRLFTVLGCVDGVALLFSGSRNEARRRREAKSGVLNKVREPNAMLRDRGLRESEMPDTLRKFEKHCFAPSGRH